MIIFSANNRKKVFTVGRYGAKITMEKVGVDMEIGVSSSCFYPELIEKSLETVGHLGAKTAEIFFNSPCELEGKILKELCRIKEYYGIQIRSVHPFTSGYEPFLIFSSYSRRTNDSIDFYKRYFAAANELGAELVVLHGGRDRKGYTPELYAENYIKLHNEARKSNLFIAQENVNSFYCSDPYIMKKIADAVGDEFRMVLDIKQCRRTNQSEFEFIDLLGDKIAQVHLSDGTAKHDCLAPGSGEYDFGKLFEALKSHGYDKTAVIELYRDNFKEENNIKESLKYLQNIIGNNA